MTVSTDPNGNVIRCTSFSKPAIGVAASVCIGTTLVIAQMTTRVSSLDTMSAQSITASGSSDTVARTTTPSSQLPSPDIPVPKISPTSPSSLRKMPSATLTTHTAPPVTTVETQAGFSTDDHVVTIINGKSRLSWSIDLAVSSVLTEALIQDLSSLGCLLAVYIHLHQTHQRPSCLQCQQALCLCTAIPPIIQSKLHQFR